MKDPDPTGRWVGLGGAEHGPVGSPNPVPGVMKAVEVREGVRLSEDVGGPAQGLWSGSVWGDLGRTPRLML